MARKKVRSTSPASHKKASRRPTRAPAKRVASTKKKSPPPALSAKARAVELLQWVHNLTNLLIDSIPADRACFQCAPTDNHLLWNLGHLAATYEWIGTLMGGQKTLQEAYNTLFGGGFKSL